MEPRPAVCYRHRLGLTSGPLSGDAAAAARRRPASATTAGIGAGQSTRQPAWRRGHGHGTVWPHCRQLWHETPGDRQLVSSVLRDRRFEERRR